MLVALVLVLVLLLGSRFWPLSPAGDPPGPSNPGRTPGGAGQDEPLDPAQLDVRLEALNQSTADDGQTGGRNPFRFQPKVEPPPPPPPPPPPRRDPVPQGPVTPQQPPGPPPITLKFIGIVEPKPGDRVAAFSDCKMTTHGREGDLVLGQYRLVKIGLESVVMEYPDGRGQTTIRLSGQECVGR
jgi:hypothetical protein